MPTLPPGLESELERLDQPVVLVKAHKVAYANRAAHRLFGAPLDSLRGQPLERLVVAERRGELRNIDEVLRGGSTRRVRSVLRREDGGRVDVSLEIEPYFDAAGGVYGASIRYEVIPGSGRMSAAPMTPRTPWPRASVQPSLSSASLSAPARADSAISTRFRRDSDSFLIPTRDTEGSGARRAPALPLDAVASSLARVKKELDWLEERLTMPPAAGSLDDSSERARALLVLVEAREHLQRAQDELEASRSSLPPFPAPPKLPSL